MEKSEELEKIYSELESGDISVSNAIKQSNKVTADIIKTEALNAVGQRTQEIFTNLDVQAAQKQWHKDYPDYNEFVESGQAKDYMKKNPMLIDETIAYFQWRADQKAETTKMETETKEPEKDRKFLKHGDEIEAEQFRTLEGMRDRRPRRREPVGESEIMEHQMNTLKKLRGE